MIIELKTADFSAKNIGNVDIPTATLLSISISGSSTVVGETSNYTCTALYEDGTTRAVTSSAAWSTSNSYALISAGLLTISESATTSQNVTITAAYRGKTTTKQVAVTYKDISDKTAAILTAYGSKTLTKTQRKAVDSLITGIDNATWKSKIKQLFIPILANDLNKSMIDVMSEGYSAYSVPTSANYELTEYGIKNLQIDGTGTEALYINTSGLKGNDFHIATMCRYDTSMKGLTEYIYAKPLASSNVSMNGQNNARGIYYKCKIAGIEVSILVGNTEQHLFTYFQLLGGYGGCIRTGDYSQAVVVDENDYPTTLANLTLKRLNIVGYQNSAMRYPHALFSCGTGLDVAEYTAYKALLDNFATAFALSPQE